MVNCLFNWLQVTICKQQHLPVCAFRCWKCFLRQFVQLGPKKKLLKGGRKPKLSSLLCRICACSLAIHLGNLGKSSYISAENFIEGVTWCGPRQLQWAWHNCVVENLRSIKCFGFLHPFSMSSASFWKQVCISLLQPTEAQCPLLTKIGRNPKLFVSSI